MAKSPVPAKRRTRLEYERLIDLGAFGPEDRLELIGGKLVVLEVYRDPATDPDRPYGSRYGSAMPLRAGAFVTPLVAPATRIAVADLLL